MTKDIKRGVFSTSAVQHPVPGSSSLIIHVPYTHETARTTTERSLRKRYRDGQITPFVKTLIIRGIGYRAFLVENDFATKQHSLPSVTHQFYHAPETKALLDQDPMFWSSIVTHEYPHAQYLVIRAGHTKDKIIALPTGVYAKTLKKDRKLVLFGCNHSDVSSVAAALIAHRAPSVYTGRGLRAKGVKILRKAGKQDKKK